MKILKTLLILSVTCSPVFAADIQMKAQGNVTEITNAKDVVSYTNNREDKEFIASLSKSYNGLKDEDKVNDLLKEQNYIEVLNSLWTEPDHAKRLQWLQNKLPENHPILMFELADEYQLKDPTLETYLNKTMPWILAGARRTYLDAICSSDNSVQAAPEMLIYNYQSPIIDNLQKTFNEEAFQKYVESHSDESKKSTLAAFKQVVKPIINDEKVPSPNWVFAHGMAAFGNEKNTISEAQCKNLRKKEAQEMMKQADEIEKTLN